MNSGKLLTNFANAVEQLQNALSTDHDTDIEKAGCIQYFEFCFELAWKVCKTTAQDLGLHEVMSPRAAIKEAFAQGWIDNEETWLDMLQSRNRMSHTYSADSALCIYEKLPEYLVALRGLLERVEKLI